MPRLIPSSYFNEDKPAAREKEIEGAEKKKSQKNAAIERAQKRDSLVNAFCKEYHIDSEGELCKSIKKILRNPATKNMPLAEYKKELDLIGSTLPTVGLDRMTVIVNTNASRGYKCLIYDNQLVNPFKKKKGSAKDNIEDHATTATTKTAKLSDFNGYRNYLENPDDNEELKRWILKEFGIEVIDE